MQTSVSRGASFPVYQNTNSRRPRAETCRAFAAKPPQASSRLTLAGKATHIATDHKPQDLCGRRLQLSTGSSTGYKCMQRHLITCSASSSGMSSPDPSVSEAASSGDAMKGVKLVVRTSLFIAGRAALALALLLVPPVTVAILPVLPPSWFGPALVWANTVGVITCGLSLATAAGGLIVLVATSVLQLLARVAADRLGVGKNALEDRVIEVDAEPPSALRNRAASSLWDTGPTDVLDREEAQKLIDEAVKVAQEETLEVAASRAEQIASKYSNATKSEVESITKEIATSLSTESLEQIEEKLLEASTSAAEKVVERGRDDAEKSAKRIAEEVATAKAAEVASEVVSVARDAGNEAAAAAAAVRTMVDSMQASTGAAPTASAGGEPGANTTGVFSQLRSALTGRQTPRKPAKSAGEKSPQPSTATANASMSAAAVVTEEAPTQAPGKQEKQEKQEKQKQEEQEKQERQESAGDTTALLEARGAASELDRALEQENVKMDGPSEAPAGAEESLQVVEDGGEEISDEELCRLISDLARQPGTPALTRESPAGANGAQADDGAQADAFSADAVPAGSIQVAQCMIPHPAKEATGGEDACLVVERPEFVVVGVCDGVGGWSTEGIDAGEYAREFVRQAAELAEGQGEAEGQGSRDPTMLLDWAHMRTIQWGSSTAIIASIDRATRRARVSNVGDCGLLHLRQGKVIQVTPPLQHSFNFPYQFACEDFGVQTDRASDAQEFDLALQPGDCLVMGSDGLLDNCFPDDIAAVVAGVDWTQAGAAQQAAEALGQKARKLSQDEKYESPFAIAANQALKVPWWKSKKKAAYRGGKVDDISVVVTYID